MSLPRLTVHRVRPGWCVLALLAAGLLGSQVCVRGSGWELSQPGDPSRFWSVSLDTGVAYDDNYYTAPNKVGRFSENISPALKANIPLERTAIGLRYSYGVSIYNDPAHTIDEAHVLDVTITHTFNPRLLLNISESLRNAISPELVQQTVSGIPTITQRRGDYLYNLVHADLAYMLSRRWTLSIAGDYDFIDYADAAYAPTYNHDDFGATVSATYALDMLTVIGINYRYSLLDYSSPASTNQFGQVSSNGRNWDAHTVYLSATRRFNPQLSLQVSGGGQWATYGDGTSLTAPWANVGAVYNYGPVSSLSAGFTHSLLATELGQYRSSESSSFYLRTDHRLTARLGINLAFYYTISDLGNAIGNSSPASLEQDSWQIAFGLSYPFTPWMMFVVNAFHEEVTSNLPGSFYNRNYVASGLHFTY